MWRRWMGYVATALLWYAGAWLASWPVRAARYSTAWSMGESAAVGAFTEAFAAVFIALGFVVLMLLPKSAISTPPRVVS